MNLYIRATIIAILAALITTVPAKADTTQDYTYYSALTQAGMTIDSPSQAKRLGQAICASLRSGHDWRLVLTEVMNGADWSVETATKVFAAATLAYCPEQVVSSTGDVV